MLQSMCKSCDFDKHLTRRYGISRQEMQNLLKLQDNKCRICKKEFDISIKRLKPCIDHRHVENFLDLSNEEKKTYIRGILCFTCNCMIGLAYEELEILGSAIEYLSRTNLLF